MATERLVIGPALGPSRMKRATRKFVPLAFFVVVIGAGYLTVRPEHPPAIPSKYSHVYPKDPAPVERPKVVGPPPLVKHGAIVRGAVRVRSFARLSALLPPGAVRALGSGTWLVTRPVAISGRAVLAVRAGTLDIGPGAYLESTFGGSITLRGVTVVGVGTDGNPLAASAPNRGFLTAYEGRLLLDHANVSRLGHLGVLAYGISFHAPLSGSGVIDSTLSDNYIGIYTTHAVGVQILRNKILRSEIYGIDPHTQSTNLTIEANQVLDSGVHGIILADRVTRSRVLGNVVQGSRDHGIVLFDHSDSNVIDNNQVLKTFDGIVITDSSNNQISHNIVSDPRRFGVRVSGASNANRVEANTFTNALVGAYVYAGPSRNILLANQFFANYEDVRVRADAPGNTVTPVPLRHELASK